MNAGISVSRVGGAAQDRHHQKLAAAFDWRWRSTAISRPSRSSPRISTRRRAGSSIAACASRVMKQKQYAPQSVAEMALSIYAVNNGYMDKVDRREIVAFEAALRLSHARSTPRSSRRSTLSRCSRSRRRA